jgi:hypothetical protein
VSERRERSKVRNHSMRRLFSAQLLKKKPCGKRGTKQKRELKHSKFD